MSNGTEIGNIGNIHVERVVARFDFKDGSPSKDQTYVIAEKDNKPTLKVKLNKMALINMSKHFYYLRRVSDDGLADNVEICGTEYDSGQNWNFVVDTDAGQKNGAIDASYPLPTTSISASDTRKTTLGVLTRQPATSGTPV